MATEFFQFVYFLRFPDRESLKQERGFAQGRSRLETNMPISTSVALIFLTEIMRSLYAELFPGMVFHGKPDGCARIAAACLTKPIPLVIGRSRDV